MNQNRSVPENVDTFTLIHSLAEVDMAPTFFSGPQTPPADGFSRVVANTIIMLLSIIQATVPVVFGQDLDETVTTAEHVRLSTRGIGEFTRNQHGTISNERQLLHKFYFAYPV